MDIEINTNTGLPGLPVGFAWRVETHELMIMKIETDWRRANHYYHSSPTEIGARQYVLDLQEKGYEARIEKVTKLMYSRFRRRPKEHVSYRATYLPQVVVSREGEFVIDEFNCREYRDDDYTPRLVLRSNITERAKVLYAKFAEQQESDSLVGTYPPKKLEVSE